MTRTDRPVRHCGAARNLPGRPVFKPNCVPADPLKLVPNVLELTV